MQIIRTLSSALCMSMMLNSYVSHAQTHAFASVETFDAEVKRIQPLQKRVFDDANVGAAIDEVSSRQPLPNQQALDAEMKRIHDLQKKAFTDSKLTAPVRAFAPNIPTQTLMQQRVDVLDIAKQYSAQTKTMDPQESNHLLVFVSFSLPEETLKRLADQVEKAKGVMVLRGFKEGSLKKTVQAIERMGLTHGNIKIHPQAFTQYRIAVVPSFVLAKAQAQSLDQEGCALPEDYVSVSGDTSIAFALEAIERQIPAFASQAAMYLTRLQGQR